MPIKKAIAKKPAAKKKPTPKKKPAGDSKNMIKPGATIGIIGGGQLGRMMAVAASQLGYRTHVFSPEKDSPAQQVATQTTHAEYDDAKAMQRFGESVDVVTYEFENIHYKHVELLEKMGKLRPSMQILRLSQHRGREKDFLNSIGVATAPFRLVTSAKEVEKARLDLGMPGILKTARFGYDGKGQVSVAAKAAVSRCWQALATDEAVYEAYIDFQCELSVIVARNPVSGAVAYPVVQNIHQNHILHTTIAPAPVSKNIRQKAKEIAIKIADALDLQGILAIEMFLTKSGQILVNELAPRPHNSGHWTMDACVTSQFEQSIRAVCNLPLGSTLRLFDAVMKNLIGEDVHLWYDYLSEPDTKLHLYGKTQVRPGRKMGHVTQLIHKKKPEPRKKKN